MRCTATFTLALSPSPASTVAVPAAETQAPDPVFSCQKTVTLGQARISSHFRVCARVATVTSVRSSDTWRPTVTERQRGKPSGEMVISPAVSAPTARARAEAANSSAV
eukprot:CAMPEP_0180502190 /NCGR_PEP_ID=MMETSP1036_2-20121128/45284_1 /TAXON_ID=632150 /ORGANISM="Azadinium spinosum, Strain 3D9" /LENGTH=107 /DNA_ID=CAMNT_0022510969 /DNA_START=30 /DNA_END=353 /DNA_ORIENTATION=+